MCVGSRSDNPNLCLVKSEAVISQGEVYVPALLLSVVKTYEMAMCSVTWERVVSNGNVFCDMAIKLGRVL